MNDYLSMNESTSENGAMWMFVSVQSVWMLLLWGLLRGLGIWSIDLYFIVSFFGLLLMRLLFVPRDDSAVWWSVLDWLVRSGFVVLAYIFYVNFLEIATSTP